jgi:transcriptional regulator with XRE-family HTH domain
MMPVASLYVKRNPGQCFYFPDSRLVSTLMAEAVGVRKTLGDNIGRIRRLRGMTVRDLSARLKELGLKLSASGISEIENAVRKVSVDELLTIAIALNTSIIDLLAPADGSSLTVAEGVRPLDPRRIEEWLQGETSWPSVLYEWLYEHGAGGWPPPNELLDRFGAQHEEFMETASETRRRLHSQDLRSEVDAAGLLQELTRQALDALENEGASEAVSSGQRANELRATLEEVVAYVNLLANRLESRTKKETR